VNKLRILHCLETVGSGGVEQRRLMLAQGLNSAQYEQALVCTQAIGGLPSKFDSVGCPVYEVGVFNGIFDRIPYARTLRIIRQFKPHVIHGAVYEGVALATVGGRIGRVPIIIGEETSDPVDRRWTGHLLYRLLCSITHQMIAVSPAVQDYLINKIHVPAQKVALVNNGVLRKPPASALQIQEIRDKYGLTPEYFIIGTVGRLVDSCKRISDLIRALSLVLQFYPEARLLIVGDGPDKSLLRDLAASLGVARKVCFTGYQADTQQYYAVMNIFALASAHEAFGLVLVEAMSTGLPVVATCVGGIPFVVKEGETGLLVEPNQPQSLAEAFLRLRQDVALRNDMGFRGKSRAAAEFSGEGYLQRVNDLYQRLAAHYLE